MPSRYCNNLYGCTLLQLLIGLVSHLVQKEFCGVMAVSSLYRTFLGRTSYTKSHLNWGVDYTYVKLSEKQVVSWKHVICPWKVHEKKGLRSVWTMQYEYSGREVKVNLILFSVVYRSQIFCFFLSTNSVDNRNAVKNLYSLDLVFKRTHLVFKLNF